MINLRPEEVSALHSNREEFYKLTLVDKTGVEKCELEMINGTITCNSERAIKKTGTLTYRVPNISRKVEDTAPDSLKVIASDNGLKFYIGIEATGMIYTLETDRSKEVDYVGIIKCQDDGVLYTLEEVSGKELELIDGNGITWAVGVETGVIYSESTTKPQKLYYREEKIEIDFLNDRVKVWMGIRIGQNIRWWPKGVFVNIQPKKKNGVISTQVYDETIVLQRTRILDDKVFLKGTPYNEVLTYLLIYSGIQRFDIEPTNLVLQTDIVLDSKKNILEWFNYFAEQINYTSVYVDDNGFFVSSQYKEPTPLNVTYTYAADEMSIITGDLNSTMDNYNIYNVFTLIVAHPQLGELVSTYINEDPTDKYSIVNTNMNYFEKPIDNVAGQVELDNLTRKEAWKAKQISQEITFETLNMPNHSIGDILDLRHPNATGVVVESAWAMPLRAGARMTHKVKRLVNLNE